MYKHSHFRNIQVTKDPPNKDSLLQKLNLTEDDTENDLVPSEYFEPRAIPHFLKNKAL